MYGGVTLTETAELIVGDLFAADVTQTPVQFVQLNYQVVPRPSTGFTQLDGRRGQGTRDFWAY